MKREEMYKKLEGMEISAIGAICTDKSGKESCYFYEDFGENLGINRAMKELYPLQEKGEIKSINFVSMEAAKKLVRTGNIKFVTTWQKEYRRGLYYEKEYKHGKVFR